MKDYSSYEEVYGIIKQYGPMTCRKICNKIAEIYGYELDRVNSEISGYLSGLSQYGHIKAVPYQKKSALRKTDLRIKRWVIV